LKNEENRRFVFILVVWVIGEKATVEIILVGRSTAQIHRGFVKNYKCGISPTKIIDGWGSTSLVKG
jgi:hypothetical protein